MMRLLDTLLPGLCCEDKDNWIDRNWLGSLRIPISTLYFNQQVINSFWLLENFGE